MKGRVPALVFALACALLGLFLGQSYISRLPNHRGYFLVPVHDEIRARISRRPRHTAVILVDGLRRDSAETMKVTERLAREGQCRVSDQGSWTVSRPVYSLLSTGLEVDRSGSRNNEQTQRLDAESIWETAKAQGLTVSGSSHLPWFEELFPQGFTRFTTAESHEDNVFEGKPLLDLNLFHPLYVDAAGHSHGAASPEYGAAVARADREIGALLATLDLTRDLVVLTADHGHRAAGGHGGSQPEIRQVLLCFAGPHVAKRTDRKPFDGRNTAAALALLLDVPFPKHMRAVEDDLDAIWEVATFEEEDAAMVAERRAALQRFRDTNRTALEGWLGGAPGTWSRLEAREQKTQHVRALIVLGLALLFLVSRLGAARRRDEIAARAAGAKLSMQAVRVAAFTTFTWLGAAAMLTWLVHRAILGEFDFTVINLKSSFVPRALAIVAIAAVSASFVHLRVVRSYERLAFDILTLVGVLAIANLGHIFVFGWPLGYPLPSAEARYFPFFGAIALLGYGLAAAVVVKLAQKRA